MQCIRSFGAVFLGPQHIGIKYNETHPGHRLKSDVSVSQEICGVHARMAQKDLDAVVLRLSGTVLMLR